MSRLAGNIGVRIAVVGLFVVGGFLFRDRLSSNANDLRVGDCFEEPTAMEVVEDVQHRPCAEAHDSEVIFVGQHSAAKGAAVPTDDEYRTYVGEQCLPAFAAYTGFDLMSQETIDIGYFVPADNSWRDGDRKIICYAARTDGTSMSQSVKTAR